MAARDLDIRRLTETIQVSQEKDLRVGGKLKDAEMQIWGKCRDCWRAACLD